MTITIALMMAIAMSAQKVELEVVDMNRTFSVGGKAIMCLRSKEATKKSLQPLEWTLKNDRIGNTNIVVLDVKNSNTGELVAHQSWSDGINIRMKLGAKDNPVLYELYDDMFSHLRIADVDLGWIILFYSEIIKDK
jgi:hypothetical protein